MNTPEATTYTDEKLGTIIQLKSGDVSAEIAVDCGSTLVSLISNGRELLHTNRDQLLEHAYTGCFVLYPFPNRIRDRKFIFEGVEYNLEKYPKRVDDDALIHGTAYDAKWNISEEPHIDDGEAVVTTSMEWDESQEYFSVFPVHSKLSLRYIVSQTGLKIEYTVENLDTKNLPFGFTLHPSFKRLSGDETTIMIPANKVLRMDSDLLPTWEGLDLNPVMFRQFDLRTPIPVTSALRLDHVYTDLIPGEHIIINHPTEKLFLHVKASVDCKYVVLHTLGKDRTIEVEPQTCSTDAVNAADPAAAGLQVLRPNETHSGYIEYAIEEK